MQCAPGERRPGSCSWPGWLGWPLASAPGLGGRAGPWPLLLAWVAGPAPGPQLAPQLLLGSFKRLFHFHLSKHILLKFALNMYHYIF